MPGAVGVAAMRTSRSLVARAVWVPGVVVAPGPVYVAPPVVYAPAGCLCARRCLCRAAARLGGTALGRRRLGTRPLAVSGGAGLTPPLSPVDDAADRVHR